MRIIFSRKGFDSAAGGCPSPIVDGRPLSLPIPSPKWPSPIRYADLLGPHGRLVADLTRGKISEQDRCHLDPDLSSRLLTRRPGWRGTLGQISAAQGHLARRGVGPGDLFLFWGLFRPVVQRAHWTFVGAAEHRIWGWLQVGAVINVGCDGSHAAATYPWLSDHPHARAGWPRSNVLYIAHDTFTLGASTLAPSGSGTLKNGYRLSKPNRGVSAWQVPDWLNPARGGVGMTYHPRQRWSDDGLRAAAQGQEFVAEVEPDNAVRDWLHAVLDDRGH